MQVLARRTEHVLRGQEALKASVQELQDNTVGVENFKQLQSTVETLGVDIDATKSSMSKFDGDLRVRIQELESMLISQERNTEKKFTDLNRQLEKVTSQHSSGGAKGPVTQQSSQDYTLTSFHSTRSYQPSGLPSESTAENRTLHLDFHAL